jgi:hypothetical protein
VIQFNSFAVKHYNHVMLLLPFSSITKMSDNINYNYNYNGSPMHQHSFASSTSSGETILWSATLPSVVSPQTQTTERETPAALFETSTSANVKDVKFPWECVDGVMMTSEQTKMSPPTPKKSDSDTPSSWMMSHGVAKKLDETNLSSEEDDEFDEDDLSEDVDFAVGNTLKWLRNEEKEKDERNKRRAEEQEEEDKKRRATEGYRPAFIIHVDGIPLEVVETERRLAAAAAAAADAARIYHNGNTNGKDNAKNTER